MSPVCEVCRLVRLDEGDFDQVLLVVVVGGHLIGGLGRYPGHPTFAFSFDSRERFLLRKQKQFLHFNLNNKLTLTKSFVII